MLSLLDCLLGYHQIWLKKADEEKTSLITPIEAVCILAMRFHYSHGRMLTLKIYVILFEMICFEP